MVNEVVDRIAATVLAREPVHGLQIVGVDGPSGSGKSYLARGQAGGLILKVTGEPGGRALE